jgi:hypothetical protein
MKMNADPHGSAFIFKAGSGFAFFFTKKLDREPDPNVNMQQVNCRSKTLILGYGNVLEKFYR